jgi:hypothetical protein
MVTLASWSVYFARGLRPRSLIFSVPPLHNFAYLHVGEYRQNVGETLSDSRWGIFYISVVENRLYGSEVYGAIRG